MGSASSPHSPSAASLCLSSDFDEVGAGTDHASETIEVIIID